MHHSIIFLLYNIIIKFLEIFHKMQRSYVKIFEMKNTISIISILCFVMAISSISAQYIFDKTPCILCFIMRILYIVISIFGILSIYRKSIFRIFCIIVFASFCFSFYHLGVENLWWDAPKSCRSELPTISDITSQKVGDNNNDDDNHHHVYCDKVNWEIFGISSTLYNFCMIGLISWILSVSCILNNNTNKKL